MRIASYNIRKAVGLDWRRDPHRIVDVIGEMDADIVVLQEADKRLGQRPGVLPLDRLRDEHGFILARHSLTGQSHGWHGNAILYRAGRFRPPGTERIPLPAREPRGAIAAHFDVNGFAVVGAHLALTTGIRKQQLHALCAHAGNSGIPTIIAGDFNHWGRQLPVGGHEVITPGLSFHASRRVAALDRFVLCGDVTALTFGVHTSLKARRASDHLPVVLDFDIPGDRRTC
ncbi:endonuclease/exonuclease/phosphatase family protein [Roseobacter sp.]|uniref:endonuclease/exonuclease/phosphatase family protein n=1 Tax=Roseobacter sp. TaxID=1907202 RepID=UPI0025D87A80|nr:endonuclease/exonuclease/phosphatase family protein [Roseobacter sp.]